VGHQGGIEKSSKSLQRAADSEKEEQAANVQRFNGKSSPKIGGLDTLERMLDHFDAVYSERKSALYADLLAT
jgi:hypothetical protein